MSETLGEVELGPSLTIRGMAAAQAALREALDGAPGARVRLAPEAEMDLLLLQLLESARRYAAAAGKRLELQAPVPPALRSLLERSGFAAAAVAPDAAAFWSGEPSR